MKEKKTLEIARAAKKVIRDRSFNVLSLCSIFFSHVGEIILLFRVEALELGDCRRFAAELFLGRFNNF